MVQALDTLDRQVTRSRAPLSFGTLVVFSDGTDRASRVTVEELDEAVIAIVVERVVRDQGLDLLDALVEGVGAELRGRGGEDVGFGVRVGVGVVGEAPPGGYLWVDL